MSICARRCSTCPVSFVCCCRSVSIAPGGSYAKRAQLAEEPLADLAPEKQLQCSTTLWRSSGMSHVSQVKEWRRFRGTRQEARGKRQDRQRNRRHGNVFRKHRLAHGPHALLTD